MASILLAASMRKRKGNASRVTASIIVSRKHAPSVKTDISIFYENGGGHHLCHVAISAAIQRYRSLSVQVSSPRMSSMRPAHSRLRGITNFRGNRSEGSMKVVGRGVVGGGAAAHIAEPSELQHCGCLAHNRGRGLVGDGHWRVYAVLIGIGSLDSKIVHDYLFWLRNFTIGDSGVNSQIPTASLLDVVTFILVYITGVSSQCENNGNNQDRLSVTFFAIRSTA